MWVFGSIILGILGLIIATAVIWVPILIIVLVQRSNKKAAAARQAQWQAMQAQQAVVQQSVDERAVKKEDLNQQMYAELKKTKPDMKLVKKYMAEIEELGNAPAPVANPVPAGGLAGYGYAGAAPNGDTAHRAAPMNYAQPRMVMTVEPPKKDNSGLNAILYVGSLLVVAGVGALVASVVPDGVKMMLMLIVVVIFYVGGLLVRLNRRLDVAGKALVGTALAIIPFLGVAFAAFLRIPGEVAWLITSVIGLFAYGFATVVLKSKVMTYLSMAFVISLALSMTATLALPMLYYFMFVMMVGVVAGLVRLFAGGKVPALFSSVVDVTGRWLTLVTLLASLCFVGIADEHMYVWLFWIATAQTGVMWIEKRRVGEEALFRLLVHASVLVTVAQVTEGDLVAVGIAFLVEAMVHGLLGIVLAAFSKVQGRAGMEATLQVVMMALSGGACLFVLLGGEERLASVVCLVAVIYTGAVSGIMAAVQRRMGWLYGVMVALVALPLVFGGWVLDEAMRWDTIIYYIVYAVMMAGSVLMRWLVGARAGFSALGIVGLVVFGWLVLVFGLSLDAIYQILALGLWVATFGVYGWIAKWSALYELAVYFGAVMLCRIMAEILKVMEVDVWGQMLTYAHTAALALIGTSVWRERGKSRVRLGWAMGILSVFVGIRALSSGSMGEMALYPMWFLILQAVFVVVGGLWRKKWMWKWGACGVGIAVWWFVRDMMFIWLLLLGFVLIGVVVYSLLKSKK